VAPDRSPTEEVLMLTIADDIDHEPVWAFDPGEAIGADLLAWEPLGVGPRCHTWLAWCTRRWCPVVAKLARPHQTTNERALAGLGREVDLLGRLAHPLFPRLLDDRRADEIPTVVVELIDGDPLDALVDEGGRLDASAGAWLAFQLAAGLRRLHALGVAHLDLKPDNVLVADGHPRLIDLASSRPFGPLRPARALLGTAGYASPELEAGCDITPTMDVFGLGAVLRDAVDAEGPLGDLVAELCQPDPARRPATMEWVLDRLAPILGDDLEPSWLPRAASVGRGVQPVVDRSRGIG